jgi:iron complex outermembrane receptor protein
MKVTVLGLMVWLTMCKTLIAQEVNSDSSRLLQSVEVRAFEHQKPLDEIPASVVIIGKQELDRFGNNSFLPALNINPGIRMEERSPGSYRLSVRGSSLRSPFGVRNVKIYWNEIPFTDPGGNTYLNLIDFSSVNNLEVIKGPGSSLYGAGTGGVLLMSSRPESERARLEITRGGYNLFRAAGNMQWGNSKRYLKVTLARQSSDGYRRQSAMERNFAQVIARTVLGKKSTLSFLGFSSKLNYQTPGGLTLAQYEADPAQARPAGGPFASAEDQHAAVNNRTSFGGITFEHEWSDRFTTSFIVYGNNTNFENPAIRNYEVRKELSAGMRVVNKLKFKNGMFAFGLENQSGHSEINVFQNNSGVKGTQTSSGRAPTALRMGFVQADFDLPASFFLTTGLSLNNYVTRFKQTVPDVFSATQRAKTIAVPRIALSKKFGKQVTTYLSIADGYSPPTTAEIYPSTAVYNEALQAERGRNLEAGLRGTVGPLNFSFATYRMNLNNAIVLRRDDSGADYFINSGKTRQQGIEANMNLRFRERKDWLRNFGGWISHSRNNFKFVDYLKYDVDLSGNRLTGTPGQISVAGIEFKPEKGFYFNFTGNYVSRIPLDDANTVFASSYYVFSARFGYNFKFKNHYAELFAGAENLTDRKYSLGNDLNAAAGRYFNAAPGRTVFGGLVIKITR